MGPHLTQSRLHVALYLCRQCVIQLCFLQQNEDFLIQVKLDKAGDLSTAHIDGEWRLKQLLSSYEALITKVLHRSKLFWIYIALAMTFE